MNTLKSKLLIVFSLILLININLLYSQKWEQIVKRKATDPAAEDLFSLSFSTYGDYAVVGSFKDSEDENGANKKDGAGSAYILYRNQGGLNKWGVLKKIVAPDRSANAKFGYDVAISGDYIIIGAYTDNLDANGLNPALETGSAYIFYKDQGGINNWGFLKKLTAAIRVAQDRYGVAVAMCDTVALVSATWRDPGTTTDGGSIFVYYKNKGGNNNWGFVKEIVTSDRKTNDYFGFDISLSGENLIVGTPTQDFDINGTNQMDNAGKVYIFNKNYLGPDNWGELKQITAPVRNGGDGFGQRVCINANDAVITSVNENSTGSAYILNRNQGGTNNWGIVKKILSMDIKTSDYFGYGCSINNEITVVGSPFHDFDVNGTNSKTDAGAVYVFGKNSGGSNNWGQVQKLTAKDRSDNARFGYSVNIDNDSLIFAGAYQDSLNSGSLYIFKQPLQASNIKIQNLTKNSMDISWTNGKGIKRCVFMKQTNTGIFVPKDSVTYVAQNSFGAGTNIDGSGWYCVYNGSGNSVSVSDLSVAQDYTIMVIEYNGTTGLEIYTKVAGVNNPQTVLTLKNTQSIINFSDIPDKTWGDPDFTVSATSTSGLDITFSSSNTSVATVTNGNVHIISAGDVTIHADQAGDASYYAAQRISKTFTISKRSLNIKVNDSSKVFYFPNPVFRITITGLVQNDSVTIPTICDAMQSSDVGNYLVIPGVPVFKKGNAGNYNIVYANGNLEIKKKDLIILAENKSKQYGELMPPLVYIVSGLEGSDKLQNVSLSTVASESSDAGTYDITCSGATFSQGKETNYNITYTKGELTITKANQSIIFFSLIDHTSNDEDFDPEAKTLSGLPITYSSSDTNIAKIINGKIHIVKAGTVIIKASQEGNKNFNPAEDVSRTLKINPSALGDLEMGLTLYPNPASQYLNVVFAQSVNRVSVSICNSIGEILLQKVLSADESVIDVSGLDAGIYFIRIDGQNIYEKIIIQK